MDLVRAGGHSPRGMRAAAVVVLIVFSVPFPGMAQSLWDHPVWRHEIISGSPGAACAAGQTESHRLISVMPTADPNHYICMMRVRPPFDRPAVWGTNCVIPSATSQTGYATNCPNRPLPDDPCEVVGNPVDPLNGSKHEVAVDYEREGEGLAVTRTFRSQSSPLAGRIGPRWSLDLDSVMTLGSTSAKLTMQTGARLDFTKGSTGPYTPATNTPWSYVNTLQNIDSTHWRFTDLDGRVDVFKQVAGSDYRLERSTERSGYSKTFVRDGTGYLQRVEDNRGMTLTLAWSVNASNDKQMVTGVTVSTDAASTADDVVVSYAYNPATHDPDPAVAGDEIVIAGAGTLARVEVLGAGMSGPEVTQYHYENTSDATLLTGITDARGVRVSTYA